MAMDFTKRPMDQAILESGSMTFKRVVEKKLGLIRVNLKVFIKKEQKMDQGNIVMPTDLFTKETGKTMPSKVSEPILG